MFGKLKKKLELKVTAKPEAAEKTEVAENPEPEVAEKPQTTKKPATKAKKTRKPDETPESTTPPAQADLKAAENDFASIKEYSSAMEIAEKIDKELAATKSALGEYLRQLDDVRAVAEKSKRLHDIVAKVAGTKQTKEDPNQIEVNGLEIVLDATPLNEITAIESVVKSHQQRLLSLQKAKEALKTLDQAGDTEGIQYLVLEREGIPEQILLKLS
jgi:hypothetical protein